MRALGLAVALMLVANVTSAQDGRLPAPDAFRVSWQEEMEPAGARVVGRVHNDSAFRVTDVRLEIQGFDVNKRAVGRTSAWAFGDILPGGEASFAFEAIPGAVSYRIAVVSYDLV